MDYEQHRSLSGRGEVPHTFSHQACAWDRRSWSACGPHLGRLYMCLPVKVELIELSSKLIKPCNYSFVDIGSNRARRDRNSDDFDSDRRKSVLFDNARVRSLLVARGVLQALQVHSSMYQRLRKHPGQPLYTSPAPSTRSDDRPTTGPTLAPDTSADNTAPGASAEPRTDALSVSGSTRR